jgi:hypothetical protein
MQARLDRRAARQRERARNAFLEPGTRLGASDLTAAQARAGSFDGGSIPADLERQWIQGTGPATRPRATLEVGLRNVAYALLSGPDKMLAYNLSPSFNWDTTGMSEDQMRAFPEELGKLGFVFNFITYGGHQIDGLAAEEFASALKQDGMLALARLQRKFRMLESPYRTPQTLVGGPRADAALMSISGRTATTRAMGHARRSNSTWCRPRFHRSCSRSGSTCGALGTTTRASCK